MVRMYKLYSELSKAGRKGKYDKTAKMVTIAGHNLRGYLLSTFSSRTFS